MKSKRAKTGASRSGPKTTPERIGQWKVESLLGVGAYGYTFKAVNAEGKAVAVKWLKENAEAAGEFRFGNEAWALKKAKHASLPAFVESGEHEGRPFIAMTLAKGRTMAAIRKQQLEQVGYCPQVQLLDILVPLLDAVRYLHSLDIVHRDIKDDNVIVNDTTTQVWLIDLGVCKGDAQPNDADTFWNAGASRFSPPSKLENPRSAKTSHDVFAVGVLAYLMLTNEFPWSVEVDGDVGKLKHLMASQKARPISEINNTVSPELVHLVDKLITLNDDDRPDANFALHEAQRICDRLRKAPIAATRSPHDQIKLPRIIRDAVHGDIRLTEAEWQILNTKEFQRLRHVKQLGFTNLVYPGAEHTRLAHSLGTMHVTERILRSIEETHGAKFPLEERLMARMYALLHDVNHITFGHTIEDELGFFKRHDANESRTERLFFSGSSSIGNALRGTEYGKATLEYFNPAASVRQKVHLVEFIDSPQGSDVIDYIDRDSLFCGLDHRVDSAIYRRYTLIRGGTSSDADSHLGLRLYGSSGIRFDAEYALERILTERYSLFLKVYAHSMKFAAGAMLGKGLQAAAATKSNPFRQEDLEWMGDSELLLRMKDSRVDVTRDMGTRLIHRELYKPVYKGRVVNPAQADLSQVETRKHQLKDQLKILTPSDREQFEVTLAKACKLRPGQVIVYCPPEPPGLQKIMKSWLETSPGKISNHENHGGHGVRVLRDRHIAMWAVYVFVDPDLDKHARNIVASEAQIMLGPENEIGQDSRKFVLALGP